MGTSTTARPTPITLETRNSLCSNVRMVLITCFVRSSDLGGALDSLLRHMLVLWCA